MDLGIWIIISALIGAKLMLLIVDWDYFSRNPRELLSLAQSGGVFYGGLILALIVALWYMWRHRMQVWAVCDVFAPGIALGHVIGRVGCFLAGCCYGRPTDVPWAVRFTDPFAAANVGTPLHIDLHPTQLYEAGAELLILGLLLGFERKGRPFAGRTFWSYMFLYGVSRFIIEMYPRRSARLRVRDGPVDVAVHLRHPGAAQPDHAVRAVAPFAVAGRGDARRRVSHGTYRRQHV